jgi:hypothetical protein
MYPVITKAEYFGFDIYLIGCMDNTVLNGSDADLYADYSQGNPMNGVSLRWAKVSTTYIDPSLTEITDSFYSPAPYTYYYMVRTYWVDKVPNYGQDTFIVVDGPSTNVEALTLTQGEE